jgi:hypothetical protein
MMNGAILLAMLLAPQPTAPSREEQMRRLIGEISESGRVLQIGEMRREAADPRQQIPPGAPPLLAFRYFHGADRHRFGNLDLMLDDAGH